MPGQRKLSRFFFAPGQNRVEQKGEREVANFKRGKTVSLPVGILTGGITGLAVSVAGAMLAGKLLDKAWIPLEAVGPAAMGIVLLSGFFAAQMAWNRVRRQRAAVCLGAGAVQYLMLLAMTALFFGGMYSGMGTVGLMVLAGCGSVVLLGMYQKAPGNQRKYRKQIRKIAQTGGR